MIFKILIAEDDPGIQKVLYQHMTELQAIFNKRSIDIQFQIFYVENSVMASECYAINRCEFVLVDNDLKNEDTVKLAIQQKNLKQAINTFQRKSYSMEEIGIAIIRTINALNVVASIDESILRIRKPMYQQPITLPGSMSASKEDKEMIIDTSKLPRGSVSESESCEFGSPFTPDTVTSSSEKSSPSLLHSSAVPRCSQLLSTTRIMNFKGISANQYRVLLADNYLPLWVKQDLSPPESFSTGSTPSLGPLSCSGKSSVSTPITQTSLFTETSIAFSASMTPIQQDTPIIQIDKTKKKSFELNEPPLVSKKLKPVREDKSDSSSDGSDIPVEDLPEANTDVNAEDPIKRPLNPTPEKGKKSAVPPLDLSKAYQTGIVSDAGANPARAASPSQPTVNKSQVSISLAASSFYKPVAAFGAGRGDEHKEVKTMATSASPKPWYSCCCG